MRHWDVAIGNPAYQEDNENNERKNPVYNYFMDESFKIADCVELIHPARFLFNAGQTKRDWNEKMLNDPHFKILEYEPNAKNIFPDTDIKGGVVISYRDNKKIFGPIEIFTEFPYLNSILHKVVARDDTSISSIIIGAVPYSFTEELKTEHPEWVELAGKSFDLRTNIFTKMYGKIFFDAQPDDDKYIRIFGLLDRERTYLLVKDKYVSKPKNFSKYKVLLPKANNSGKFGEALAPMEIGEPYVGHTQTFISIGGFDTQNEALALEKYLKTKFCRCMLSVLKKTQDITPDKFKYVPLQDFTNKSDIDWSKSIAEIDQQLYKKYGLSDEEVSFIETNVKEMK